MTEKIRREKAEWSPEWLTIREFIHITPVNLFHKEQEEGEKQSEAEQQLTAEFRRNLHVLVRARFTLETAQENLTLRALMDRWVSGVMAPLEQQLGRFWGQISWCSAAVQNITFGYTLPKNLTRKLQIEGVRLYFVADNVALLTARKGLDPRQGYVASDNVYSPIRTISGGISLNF